MSQTTTKETTVQPTDLGWLTEQQILEILDDTNRIIPLEYEDETERDPRKIKVKIPGWGYDPDGPPWGLTGGTRSGLFGCGPTSTLPAGYVNWVSAVYDHFRVRDEEVPELYRDKYPY